MSTYYLGNYYNTVHLSCAVGGVPSLHTGPVAYLHIPGGLGDGQLHYANEMNGFGACGMAATLC